ncbi:hypothetical protein AXA44_00980 [Rhodococcus sp. SC4]|nr:hypothetical protein AXA44_00980 [Rhodococcus sp. SC4]
MGSISSCIWTVEQAIAYAVPAPMISAALLARFSSIVDVPVECCVLDELRSGAVGQVTRGRSSWDFRSQPRL